MGEDSFPGAIELICGIWFILKFFGLNVNFLGQGTGILVCVFLVLISSIHVSSVKDNCRAERAGTTVTFGLMLAAISIAFVFASLGGSSSVSVNHYLSLSVGIIAVITALVNFS